MPWTVRKFGVWGKGGREEGSERTEGSGRGKIGGGNCAADCSS